jgi:hypothetical protein
MKDKLVIVVVGNRNSGKSLTWNALFGRTVRTGNRLRRLYLSDSELVKVFLVSGSPEERRTYVGDIIGKRFPRIVLCSMQYRADATETIGYFLQHGYRLYVQWLNPGFADAARQSDTLDLMRYLLDQGAIVSIRDGQVHPTTRVQEIRDFIDGWVRSRGLVKELIGPTAR